MFSVLQPVNSRTCYFKTMLVPASSNYVRTEQQIENVGKNRAGFRRAEERVICPEGLMSGKTLVS